MPGTDLIKFGTELPLRTPPEPGALRVEFVFRSDDGRYLTFHGDVDRWASSAILIGREDAPEQLLMQMRPLFRGFCREIYYRFGLGASGGTPDGGELERLKP